MDSQDTPRDGDAGHSGGYSRIQDTTHLPESVLQAVTEKLVNRLAKKLPEMDPLAVDLQLAPPTDELDAFCDALITHDPGACEQFFDRLQARDLTPDALCLRWIGPAARRLGERWVADKCRFLEVTLGSARLHGLLRNLRGAFVPGSIHLQAPPREMSALFCAAPGETHVLGVTMAAEFFRRAGWRVDLQCAADIDDLASTAENGDYRLIGLSGSCEATLGALKDSVQRLRDVKPDAKIILGGHITELEPDIAQHIGIDDVLTDVTVAPITCQSLVMPS